MKVIKAPKPFNDLTNTVFLAGSIEMGVAANWQNKVINAFKDTDIVFLNPRRDDWDSSWKQSIDDPQFLEQVMWEQDGLESCDFIIMYLDPETKSPISLLELGQYCTSGKIIVCCPDGFYRKGNVEIVCMRNSIPLMNSLDELIKFVSKMTTDLY